MREVAEEGHRTRGSRWRNAHTEGHSLPTQPNHGRRFTAAGFATHRAADRVVRDSVPEGDYVSQAVGLGPTTLWSHTVRVSARETADTGTLC